MSHGYNAGREAARQEANRRAGAINVPPEGTRVERRDFSSGARTVTLPDGRTISEAQYEAEAPQRAEEVRARLDAESRASEQARRVEELRRDQLSSGRFVEVNGKVVPKPKAAASLVASSRGPIKVSPGFARKLREFAVRAGSTGKVKGEPDVQGEVLQFARVEDGRVAQAFTTGYRSSPELPSERRVREFQVEKFNLELVENAIKRESELQGMSTVMSVQKTRVRTSPSAIAVSKLGLKLAGVKSPNVIEEDISISQALARINEDVANAVTRKLLISSSEAKVRFGENPPFLARVSMGAVSEIRERPFTTATTYVAGEIAGGVVSLGKLAIGSLRSLKIPAQIDNVVASRLSAAAVVIPPKLKTLLGLGKKVVVPAVVTGAVGYNVMRQPGDKAEALGAELVKVTALSAGFRQGSKAVEVVLTKRISNVVARATGVKVTGARIEKVTSEGVTFKESAVLEGRFIGRDLLGGRVSFRVRGVSSEIGRQIDVPGLRGAYRLSGEQTLEVVGSGGAFKVSKLTEGISRLLSRGVTQTTRLTSSLITKKGKASSFGLVGIDSFIARTLKGLNVVQATGLSKVLKEVANAANFPSVDLVELERLLARRGGADLRITGRTRLGKRKILALGGVVQVTQQAFTGVSFGVKPSELPSSEEIIKLIRSSQSLSTTAQLPKTVRVVTGSDGTSQLVVQTVKAKAPLSISSRIIRGDARTAATRAYQELLQRQVSRVVAGSTALSGVIASVEALQAAVLKRQTLSIPQRLSIESRGELGGRFDVALRQRAFLIQEPSVSQVPISRLELVSRPAVDQVSKQLTRLALEGAGTFTPGTPPITTPPGIPYFFLPKLEGIQRKLVASYRQSSAFRERYIPSVEAIYRNVRVPVRQIRQVKGITIRPIPIPGVRR